METERIHAATGLGLDRNPERTGTETVMMTVGPLSKLYEEITLPVSSTFCSRAEVCVTVVFRDLGLFVSRRKSMSFECERRTVRKIGVSIAVVFPVEIG